MTDYRWFVREMELIDNDGVAKKVQRKGKFLFITLSESELKKYVRKSCVNIEHSKTPLYRNKKGAYIKYRGHDVYILLKKNKSTKTKAPS